MPTYEYRCARETCQHEFETTQKITEVPKKLCPKCEHWTLVRLISKCFFRLKGGGWSPTGYDK